MARRLPPWLAAALALLACEDGGPAGFQPLLDVSGEWTEVATLVENTCGAEIPPVSTSTLVLTQSGGDLTVEVPGFVTATGTIDPRSGEFEFAFTVEFTNGTGTYVQTGRFRSRTAYESTSRLELVLDGGGCLVRSREAGSRG